MRHITRRLTLATVALVTAATALSPSAAHSPAPRVTDHVLLMVFDQMRPDYIDRFGLANFKRLRDSSRNYPEAYVGHLSSQTVVAHMVIPTGLRPGALPWVDDVLVDEDGALGKPGLAYNTGKLTRPQTWQLLKNIPRDQFLPARIQDTLGGKVFAVGTKDYAAAFLGGPYASGIVTMTACAPDGVNVPDYILTNHRFTVDCTPTYGTDYKTIYAIDGNRSVPGKDPTRQGGDVWTADAAIEIMNREQWSGMFLTFGGIDKIAHMLGEQDDRGLTSVPSEYRLADALRIADEQLGRVLGALEARGLADRTLVVVTADHGGQKNQSYLGNNGDQTCCALANGKLEPKVPYWLEHLNAIAPGKLRTAYAATSLTLWLADRSPAVEATITSGLKDVSGITEIYALRRTGNTYRYEQVFSALESQPAKFRNWAQKHSAELLATMAGPAAPDLVGLLADGVGFGRIGDHGGAQELVQRIPMILRVPGEAASRPSRAMRLMDVAPEITKVLALKPAPRLP